MQTLTEWNGQRMQDYTPKKNMAGVACPHCGAEMMVVTLPRHMTFIAYPPRTPVWCECGFRGHKVV